MGDCGLEEKKKSRTPQSYQQLYLVYGLGAVCRAKRDWSADRALHLQNAASGSPRQRHEGFRSRKYRDST